ncbi:MAG: M99 family carboxypeptidase catalytic domain-containing protein, partial [Candidatus Omnitrophica bacterium]|nr:M99 family carboxypeptidase catalytic domain-containing protein [Candidatus Omnitrophota bacterium]
RLNAVAISRKKRQGLGGDMNRLFDLSEEMSRRNPDARVVEVAKTLIQQADYILNLHQGYDFYDPRWISRYRNPSRWGQSNVIDTPIYHLPNGDKLKPGCFVQAVCLRSNDRIKNRKYHFLVKDTDTGGSRSRHREQKGSLTYYALTKQHKIAFAVEATKNCPLPQAVGYLTAAINAAMEEAGIQSDAPPSEEVRIISRDMAKVTKRPKLGEFRGAALTRS